MANEHTDWQLIAQVQAGDDRPFDELMQRYQRPLLNFIYRMTGDAHEAQDVAQDVFVRAYQTIIKRSLNSNRGAFSTWLFQVARNAAIDAFRRRKRRPTEALTTLAENGAEAASPARPADREIAAREISAQIAAAVARLPEDQRTALVLAEYQELSYTAIAAIMQCSVKSVEARLYRARQFLRPRLAHLLE